MFLNCVKFISTLIHHDHHTHYHSLMVAIFLHTLVLSLNGLRLTNMTAPALQDPRKPMELHCRFDMGGEDLYAVKWYKDDHEFFRYIPGSSISILQFPVDGIKVDSNRTKCMRDGCDLLLIDLLRPQSSGAYRCEVSSEAPAFRLASQTHNVTIAALPETSPKLEGIMDSYLVGDLLVATCISGLGDPKPSITWFVNKQQVPSKSMKLLPSIMEQDIGRIKLKSTTSQLRLLLDKKLIKNRPKSIIEITCTSSLDGINPIVAPPLNQTKNIIVIDQNQFVNNQKLHSPFSSTNKINLNNNILLIISLIILLMMIVINNDGFC